MDSAYIAALRMLSARELSERQLRQRLTRRGYDEEAIDAAVSRLKTEGSLNDERAAHAMANDETRLRKRGRLRVTRRLEAAGIARDVAERAVRDVFETVDGDALMNGALQKRLRGHDDISDDRQFQQLYRYLVGQGFEPDRVLTLLRRRRKGHED